MLKDKGERRNLAHDPKYSKILAEHRALLDDYIRRTQDDYRSLKLKPTRDGAATHRDIPTTKDPAPETLSIESKQKELKKTE